MAANWLWWNPSILFLTVKAHVMPQIRFVMVHDFVFWYRCDYISYLFSMFSILNNLMVCWFLFRIKKRCNISNSTKSDIQDCLFLHRSCLVHQVNIEKHFSQLVVCLLLDVLILPPNFQVSHVNVRWQKRSVEFIDAIVSSECDQFSIMLGHNLFHLMGPDSCCKYNSSVV